MHGVNQRIRRWYCIDDAQLTLTFGQAINDQFIEIYVLFGAMLWSTLTRNCFFVEVFYIMKESISYVLPLLLGIKINTSSLNIVMDNVVIKINYIY